MGRDLELGGDVFTIEAGYKRVHNFWNRWGRKSPFQWFSKQQMS